MSVTVSTDRRLLDLDVIHRFLSEVAYWARGVPRDVLARAVAESICFGAYEEGAQAGFARVVTDRATVAWLCDVLVLPEHRGKGVARRIMDAVMAHPDLQGLRLFVLGTRDARGLYARYGFGAPEEPGRDMVIHRPYLEPA